MVQITVQASKQQVAGSKSSSHTHSRTGKVVSMDVHVQ